MHFFYELKVLVVAIGFKIDKDENSYISTTFEKVIFEYQSIP